MRSSAYVHPGDADPRCADKGVGFTAWAGTRSCLLFDDLAPIVTSVENKTSTPLPAFENRQAGDGRPTKRHRRETDQLKAGLLDIED